ncbi:MAG: response regulator/pilus assembly protein [Chloroflexi bacterium]|nr:response regulator/pilus assembly protein [Chloroflexota bacterium]
MAEQEKIRVLIVDDLAEARENIRRLLQFDLSNEVVGVARTGQEAIQLSEQLKPDVVIMDINMPDMDGITATEAIRRKVPFAQVVILSVQNDPNYMRRAMLVGARDFITKPPSIDELNAAVNRAGKMAQEERTKATVHYPGIQAGTSPFSVNVPPAMGKVIAVYSPKGGTGCTTIAANLAIALRNGEQRVLLVDGDLQYGDVAIFLNEPVRNNVLDLISRADELDPEIIDEVILKHDASGLHLLAAPIQPELDEQASGEKFSKLLQYLCLLYDYVVVDTASYLSDIVQSALEMADLITLVTTQDIPAIKNSNTFLALADASGIQRSHILFVMNRFDKKIAISPQRVSESLHQEIVITIPFEEKVVSNSINRGVPFLLDNKTLPVSKTIYALADLIRERIAQSEETELEPARKK